LLDLKNLIDKFFQYFYEKNIEIYNEFSFQHELGIFLRRELPDYKVQFERNISYFRIKTKTIKKEIDISIFNIYKTEIYAIELKFPNNGQYPEAMYSIVKDIKFIEELKEEGFTKNAVIIFVLDKLFYGGNKNSGIYKYFRKENKIYGDIYKPTGITKKIEFINIKGKYNLNWKTLSTSERFCIIEI